ncbi:thiamine phosphate synthase [Nocardioides aquaticus]|uniref:thiamine phosphate synthase n=1 Tax=Nocardioides TaxID=1839 RepID=UPI001BD4FB12|nr:thiamine phosphate synthase [Nocardioides aquaticus]
MPAKEVNLDVLPRIHLISDPTTLDRASLDVVVRTAGTVVDAIQVRAKGAKDGAVAAWTAALVAAVRPLGTRVIVNDRLDIALMADADGVHLGAEDLPVDAVRFLAPEGFLIGATCRGPEGARAARAQGADYVGLGPVYRSTTKADLPDPVGLDVLAQTSRVLPTIAIGGVTVDRVPDVMAAGAYGVAVVAAVWQASDPPRVAKEIADLVHVA